MYNYEVIQSYTVIQNVNISCSKMQHTRLHINRHLNGNLHEREVDDKRQI